jgi:hypothetical protein
MKRINNYMRGIILCILLLSVGRISHATVEKDWEKAKSENTISAYEAFLQKYPNGTFTQQVYKQLEELYLQRLQQTEIYRQWRNEQSQQVPSDELTDSKLIQSLSRSTGALAQTLISQALSTACQGHPSDYSAVLAISGIRHVVMQNTGVPISLLNDPYHIEDMNAMTPGDAYYAICLTKRIEDLEKCTYKPSGLGEFGQTIGYIVTQQIMWSITIHDIRTGKQLDARELRGHGPNCPSTASFATGLGQTQYIIGDEPSSSEVLEWINQTVASLTPVKERIPLKQSPLQGSVVSVKLESVRMFSQPEFKVTLLEEVRYGTKLGIIDETQYWYKVKTLEGKIGWVAKDWVE